MGNCLGSPANLPADDDFQAYVWRVHRNIYVSGYAGAKDLKALKRLGITHILNLVGESLYSMPEVGPVEETYYPDHFVYKHITSSDLPNQNLRQFFLETSPFIREGNANGGVLVHCWAGVSRSVSCICAYLMDSEGYTFHEALNYVRINRPVANPNEGFRQQLELYEQDLMSQGRVKPKHVPHARHYAVNYSGDAKQIYGQTPVQGSPPPTAAIPSWQSQAPPMPHSAQPQHMGSYPGHLQAQPPPPPPPPPTLYSSQVGGPGGGAQAPQQPMGLYASHGYMPQHQHQVPSWQPQPQQGGHWQ